jgi:carbon monoxide dehydrogenase subunit G
MCGRRSGGSLVAMAEWTTSTRAKARPEQVLEVLTDPEAIRLWSPIDFDVEDLDGVRLAAGSTARVSGKLAGVRVGFEVEVHAADEAGVELTAHGPIGIDVHYDLMPSGDGSEVTASVALRRGGGISSRILSQATAAMLSAGALDGAARGIARAAEGERFAGTRPGRALVAGGVLAAA